MIERKQLARQLHEAATLLDVLGEEPFRARAYASAARGVDAFEGEFAELVAARELTRIRGIGSSLAAEIEAAPADGMLPLLAELRGRVPEEVRELFLVSGLGAGKVRALWQAGFGSLEALVAGVERGEVQALKGFGAKSAAAVAAGAEFVLDARAQMRRDEAEAIAEAVAEGLRHAIPGAEAHAVGDLRRGMETVRAVDLLVTGASHGAVEAFAVDALTDVAPDPASADAGSTVAGRLAGRSVRIATASVDAAGAAMLVRTGSEAYVARLRARAAELGLRLDAGGLFRGATLVRTPTEASAFEALGVAAPAPELREDPDAAPVEGLIELGDLRGLVHNHSTWSDAEHSIREMVAAARARGFAYLAMADHSRSSFYASGLSADGVRRQAEEIQAIRAELRAEGSDFELLHGIEVDILPDGALDYEDEVLELLDYAVVSVHQRFGLGRDAQTARMVAAVQSPFADILGHATGRLLLRRPGYDVDLDAVIDACAAADTVIEINAHPSRLDMDWRWVRRASERGCRFSIDPDAHHVDGFDDLRFGIAMARKAGLTAAHVVSSAATGRAFLARLKRARRR